jgi:hypothetical protein
MSAPMLPVLHIICANDRDGDPRPHAFIDRLIGMIEGDRAASFALESPEGAMRCR